MQVVFVVVSGASPSPELHSISPSKGDAADSRNVLSLTKKQRLWEQNVTGHKEKQGRKKRLLRILNILWLKTRKKKSFIKKFLLLNKLLYSI